MAKQPASPPRQDRGETPAKKTSWMHKWGQIVLSALSGAIIALVSIVLSFASVRDTAAANSVALKTLAPQVHALQITRAADDAATIERWRSLNRRLDQLDKHMSEYFGKSRK